LEIATVSDVLIRAAALLDKGVCYGANARLAGGKACGVFDQRAEVRGAQHRRLVDVP